MTWLVLLVQVIVPILVKLIERLIPERVTHKRGEMKWVKKKKEQAIGGLQRFNKWTTNADIAAKGKKEGIIE